MTERANDVGNNSLLGQGAPTTMIAVCGGECEFGGYTRVFAQSTLRDVCSHWRRQIIHSQCDLGWCVDTIGFN